MLADNASITYYNYENNYSGNKKYMEATKQNQSNPLKNVLNNISHAAITPQSFQEKKDGNNKKLLNTKAADHTEIDENGYNKVGESSNVSKHAKTQLIHNKLSNEDKIDMTENAYYESIELKSHDSSNQPSSNHPIVTYSKPDKTTKTKLVNLFKQPHRKESETKLVYDYAYQHFELEGRKRSPKKP